MVMAFTAPDVLGVDVCDDVPVINRLVRVTTQAFALKIKTGIERTGR